jgi:trehalose 6-phosphate synthase
MKKLIVVSNRLPIVVDTDGESLEIRQSSGGLVSALNAVFRKYPGSWIGWPGVSSLDREIDSWPNRPEVKLVPVFLSERERQDFYCGFSNEIIWPLFHDLQSRCNFDPSYWNAYVEVNRRFTAAVLEEASPDDLVWVHDYHLALMGSQLREKGGDLNVVYFQHIPFPSWDIFEKLPWGAQIIESMLAFKIIGFQTERDLRNFTNCVANLNLGRVHKWSGEYLIEHQHGTSTANCFPVSIDYEHFATEAVTPHVEEKLASMREEFSGKRVILGVDRLDYTKGLPERLRSFARALELYPELRKNVSFIQVVVPSREGIPKYQDLKMEVERLVGEINGRYTDAGWIPIHFLYRHLDRPELLAYYRLADIALITPLKDGMNLVAKEYCAADVEEDGVLIISRFAGTAADLGTQALQVNPNDYDQVARQLNSALQMRENERRGRMSSLRAQIRRFDVNYWIESFLQECTDKFDEHHLAAQIARNRTFDERSNQLHRLGWMNADDRLKQFRSTTAPNRH